MFFRTLIAGLFVLLMLTDSAPAQMFNPIQELGSNTRLQNAGRLSGDRRFLRQNRRRGDFVGRSVDPAQGFVGQTQGQAVGRVQTAVSTLQEEPVVPVNTPRPASSRTGIYEPRLSIGFEGSPTPVADQQRRIQAMVSRSLALRFQSAIEVSLESGVATLHGVVESNAAKEQAELIALFEPGVDSVQNELIVQVPVERRIPADSP